MRRQGIAAVLAVALLAAGCASSSGPRPPSWLERNAELMKKSLGDPDARLSYVLGPFPIAIVQGDLTCGGCSRPADVPAQTGSVAAARYDGGTRQGTDFSILHGSVRKAIAGVCSTHDPSCAGGGRARRGILREGVAFGSDRRVIHYSDAESRHLAEATLTSWRSAIETRARKWPQYHWKNPSKARTTHAINDLARRYQFRVTRLVWRTPKQLAPEVVVETAHYRAAALATRKLVGLMEGYEGYYFEVDDERGVPFIYVSRYRRGPSGGGRWWTRSDPVAPFLHG